MCNIVVYHDFQAILGFLEETWWSRGADHWSEEGAEDEYFEQNVGEMEAVRLVVSGEGLVLMAEIG